LLSRYGCKMSCLCGVDGCRRPIPVFKTFGGLSIVFPRESQGEILQRRIERVELEISMAEQEFLLESDVDTFCGTELTDWMETLSDWKPIEESIDFVLFIENRQEKRLKLYRELDGLCIDWINGPGMLYLC
jgi:hypothetical protein